MNKIYSLVAIPILWLLPNLNCEIQFESKSVSSSPGEYALELEMKEGSSDEYTFELYDLVSGNLVSKKKAFFGVGENKVVFEKVKPSTYSVYYYSSTCSSKKSIKGKGIVLP